MKYKNISFYYLTLVNVHITQSTHVFYIFSKNKSHEN